MVCDSVFNLGWCGEVVDEGVYDGYGVCILW